MKTIKSDNTVITNGIIKNKTFYPKMNLPSATMRIVLTTNCNYRCKYCFAEGEIDKKERILDIEKLKKVLLISKEFGITNIKLTGGEPLLYPHLEELLKYIREIDFSYVDLTTNISLLNEKNIKLLNKYKVNALTLSLNTFDCKKFTFLSQFNNYKIVYSNLEKVLKKFEGSIRINCIVFDKLYDENDYNKILEFCKNNSIGLRLVEPSRVENFEITYGKEKFNHYINQLRKKADRILKSDCESVEYFYFDNWYLTVMHSLCDNRLCDSCKKYMYIRVSSEMKLKPCLSRRDTEVPINFFSDNKIRESFIEAIGNMGKGLDCE